MPDPYGGFHGPPADAQLLMTLCLMVLSLVSAGSAQTNSMIGSLEPGKPVERELAGGQTHEYRIELPAGQYFHVVVDQ